MILEWTNKKRLFLNYIAATINCQTPQSLTIPTAFLDFIDYTTSGDCPKGIKKEAANKTTSFRSILFYKAS